MRVNDEFRNQFSFNAHNISEKKSHCVFCERWKKRKKKNRGKSSWVRGKDNFRCLLLESKWGVRGEKNSKRLVRCWWEKLFLYNLCSFFHSSSLQERKINTSCVCRQRRWVFEKNCCRIENFSFNIWQRGIGKT